jgi:serine/threonine protein phosphatase 1
VLYTVGDIHGRLDRLDALLASLPLREDDQFVFLGDYIDRGPDSKGVIDRLIALARNYPCVFLLGNHESMFLDFLGWGGKYYFAGEAFLANGGVETLLSYDYFEADHEAGRTLELPPGHEEFFKSLRLTYHEGEYLFVHAGLGRALLRGGDLRWALRRARPEEVLWDRFSCELPHELGVTIVYGHTPRPDFAVRWNPPFSIGIDTGAGYGGPLTAMRLPDETVFQADDSGTVERVEEP